MTVKSWLRIAVGVVISGVLVWRAYSGTDLGEMGHRIVSARPLDFALSVAAYLVACMLRSWRWQLCFDAEDRLTFWQSFGAYGLGSLSTFVIPARLGDLLRVYVLGQNSGISKSKALGTLVVERLSDMFAVVIVLAILLPMFSLPAGIKTADGFAALVAAVALVFVYILARKGTALPEPAWVANRRPLEVLFRLLIQLIHGFSAVKSARRGLLILLVSFGVWVFQIAQFGWSATALGLPLGWRESSLITGVLALTTIIPAGPGYAGTFELTAISTLALFGVDDLSTKAFLNLSRASSLIALVIWGGAGLIALRMSRPRSATESVGPAVVAERQSV